MINAFTLILGSLSFLAAFSFHVLFWRVARPVKQFNLLIYIFFIFPFLAYAAIFCLCAIFIDYPGCFIAYPDNLFFTVLWHFLLSSAYIISYPAIQAESPSLRIILAVRRSMPEGLDIESISGLFTEKELLLTSFTGLVDEKLIYFKDGLWVISKRGRVLSHFFSSYRRLLKLP